MIRLTEILNIDSLTYGEPAPKHITKMKKDFGVFNGFPIDDYMSYPPDKNGSEKVKAEIKKRKAEEKKRKREEEKRKKKKK